MLRQKLFLVYFHCSVNTITKAKHLKRHILACMGKWELYELY